MQSIFQATVTICASQAPSGCNKMRDVFIVGVGQTKVGEHWGLGLRELGAEAILAALGDAGEHRTDALFVGNMLSGQLSGQENLATMLADATGLLPIEAVKIEAACGSGGAAVRAAMLAVAAGAAETAIALGVEKMTDVMPDVVTAALATASDHEYEAGFGLSFVGMAALIMQRFLHETGRSHDAFAPFIVNAHRNAMTNEHAMFHLSITPEQFSRSPLVASPMGLLDVAPVCDGAAAILVCSRDAIKPHHKPVRIAGSAIATDTISLGARKRMTWLQAAETSAAKAFQVAKLTPSDIDVAEPHDAFTIMTALTLEASGFAKPGTVLDMANAGAFAPDGDLPICTFGGLKARGHPVGASGTYQIVEACRQLRGDAGKNQIAGAKRAFAQSIGGHGAVAVSHILEA